MCTYAADMWARNALQTDIDICLSAHAPWLLRAEELGDILLPAYDTPTGIPYQTLNLRTRSARNPSWTQRSSILSELGTQQARNAPCQV